LSGGVLGGERNLAAASPRKKQGSFGVVIAPTG
jgi:hypothetical protein